MTAISEQLVAKIDSVILIKCCLKMHFNCKTVVFDLMVLENKVCFWIGIIFIGVYLSVYLSVCVSDSLLTQKVLNRFS